MKSLQIIFNYHQGDSCFNYTIKLKLDSIFVTKRVDDKVVKQKNEPLLSPQWSEIKDLLSTHETVLSDLAKESVKNHNWNGVDFLLEAMYSNKSSRFFIADIPSNKLLKKESRIALKDLKLIYNKIIESHIAEQKQKSKLNNF